MEQRRDELTRRPLYGISSPLFRENMLTVAMFPVYDLPSDILSTLRLKDDIATIASKQDSDQLRSQIKAQSDDRINTFITATAACSLCKQSFYTVEEQRSHVRSDLHNYNLKQKLRGSGPVSELEFESLVKGMIQLPAIQQVKSLMIAARFGRKPVWLR